MAGDRKRRRVELDEDVLAVAQMGRRQRVSPAERRRLERQEQQTPVTWELDRVVARLVREVGEALEICPGGVASRLLLEGLRQYADGEIDFEGFLVPSRSPRYWWAVDMDSQRGEVMLMVNERLKMVLDDGES